MTFVQYPIFIIEYIRVQEKSQLWRKYHAYYRRRLELNG